MFAFCLPVRTACNKSDNLPSIMASTARWVDGASIVGDTAAVDCSPRCSMQAREDRSPLNWQARMPRASGMSAKGSRLCEVQHHCHHIWPIANATCIYSCRLNKTSIQAFESWLLGILHLAASCPVDKWLR